MFQVTGVFFWSIIAALPAALLIRWIGMAADKAAIATWRKAKSVPSFFAQLNIAIKTKRAARLDVLSSDGNAANLYTLRSAANLIIQYVTGFFASVSGLILGVIGKILPNEFMFNSLAVHILSVACALSGMTLTWMAILGYYRSYNDTGELARRSLKNVMRRES